MINTHVAYANNTGLENVFIPRGRSLKYRINKCPRIDPRGTLRFIVPQWEESFS